MSDRRQSVMWASLHAAIARACRAQGDTEAHHRALIDDLRNEPASEIREWIDYFEAQAARANVRRAA